MEYLCYFITYDINTVSIRKFIAMFLLIWRISELIFHYATCKLHIRNILLFIVIYIFYTWCLYVLLHVFYIYVSMY